MARLFKLNFSLRKVALVILEMILLSVVILPLSDWGAFVKLINGDEHMINSILAPTTPIYLAGLELLGFMLLRVLFIVLITQACFFVNDLYNWKITSNPGKTYIRLLESVSYSLILCALSHYLFQGLDHYFYPDRGEYLGLLQIKSLNLLACIATIYIVSYYYRILFHWTLFTWKIADHLLMVGIDSMTDLIHKELQERKDPGYVIAGYVVEDPAKYEGNRKILGSYEDIFHLVRKHEINRIVVSSSAHDASLPINELLNCRIKGIHVEDASLIYERITNKIAIEKLHPTYLIFSEGFDQHKFTYIFKRILDLGVAVAGLVLALPIILVTALLVKCTSKGPIFHKQKRVGMEGKIFTLYKFRSMYVDAEKKTGPVWAKKDDDRITSVGRFIRKLRIDEIPQMWNVIHNDMSFVGPRPERPFFVDELKGDIPYYTERLVVKPGITGWAQINYMYGSSKEDALQKLQYDLYYIKNMSIFLDIIILLRTIKVVIRREGAV